MFGEGENPFKIQDVPIQRRNRRPTPLVLLHDGGGTTFSYFLMGSLGRDVWAIHNPNYETGKLWEGGMDEMAKHYLGLLDKAGIKGPVILGGWSLAAYLSLVMARILADDPQSTITVKGFIFIDSPYHIARSKLPVKPGKAKLKNIPDLIQKSFDNCDIMLQNWDLPPWPAPACKGKKINVAVSGGGRFDVLPSESLYKPSGGEWRKIEVKQYDQYGEGTGTDATAEAGTLASPPPAVMIRCDKPVPLIEKDGNPCVVDVHREKTLLGWDGSHPDFIKATIDFDTHHYDVFDKFDGKKNDRVTACVNEGLGILDSLRVSLT